MSVRLQQNLPTGGIYFITFTCFAWKPLFQITQAYDAVYKWFHYLADKRPSLTGYGAVKKREAKKGQIHKVFEESYDAKECFSIQFILQKLAYMHPNPVSGKWSLVQDFALYPHSSAGFYFGTGTTAFDRLTSVEDVVVEENPDPGVSPQG